MSYETSSMAKHLSKIHNLCFKKKEETQITQFADNFTPNKLSRAKSDEAIQKLSLSLAQSTAPFRLVDNENFKAALNILNPSFEVPSHQTIGRVVGNCFKNLILDIQSKLDKASYVSLCVDFWSGKNMVGYLGVVASFIEEGRRNDILIALKGVPYPHTGQVVKESLNKVLIEFGFTGVNDGKIISISTDNGSNMVAELRDIKSNYKDAFDSDNNSENDSLIDDISDDNDDFSVDEDETEPEFSVQKRIPCLNHVLNNNLKIVVPKQERPMNFLNKIKEIIRKLRFKGIVNDYCRKHKIPKLLLPPLTRWRYYFHMCRSVLNARPYLHEICSLANVDILTIREFEMIESMCEIFEQYEHYTGMFEKNDSKLFDAIPSIISLWLKLKSNIIFKDFCLNLIDDLIKRTECIFFHQYFCCFNIY